MNGGRKILDMGGRSAIQTAIAFIIAPTKKKRHGAAKKKKEGKLNKVKSKRKASGTSDPYNYSLPFVPEKKHVKNIMDVCVHDESHCQCAKELLLESLSSNNSHVRLLVLQIIDHMFRNLEKFRQKLSNDMRNIVLLCIGNKFSANGGLPPPVKFAKFLRERFTSIFEDWYVEFGSLYKPLRIAYAYLKDKRGVKFSGTDPRKRMKIGNRFNDACSSSAAVCVSTDSWKEFSDFKRDEMCTDDMEEAIKIVEEALELLVKNQKFSGQEMAISDVYDVINKDENASDSDDEDDGWLDAETNLPLSEDSISTINNKYGLLVQKMKEYKKLIDNKYSNTIEMWMAKLGRIVSSLGGVESRVSKVKCDIDKLKGLRNRIDLLNEKYNQYEENVP